MLLRNLRYLTALAHEKHFARAAQLDLTPSEKSAEDSGRYRH